MRPKNRSTEGSREVTRTAHDEAPLRVDPAKGLPSSAPPPEGLGAKLPWVGRGGRKLEKVGGRKLSALVNTLGKHP